MLIEVRLAGQEFGLVEVRLEQFGAEGIDPLQGRDKEREPKAGTVKPFGPEREFAIQKEVAVQQ
jgi:hypothetical protein